MSAFDDLSVLAEGHSATEDVVVTVPEDASLLFVEGTAFVVGDATMSIVADGNEVGEAFVRGGNVTALYDHYLMPVEPGEQHRFALRITGAWDEESVRVRVMTVPPEDEHRLRPAGEPGT